MSSVVPHGGGPVAGLASAPEETDAAMTIALARRGLLAAPLAVPLTAPLLAARPAAAQPAGVVLEEFTCPGGAPGVELYLRNKRPENAGPARPDRTVLCVHGATYPASTGFDLPLAGVSWLDYMAGRGFDAWTVDLRNYGRSSRAEAMSRPPEGAVPLTTADEALADLAAAARFVRERRGVSKLCHLGWSWGTTLAGRFAAENPALVEKLVLYAPVWTGGAAAVGGNATIGAYRTVTRAQARERWMNGVPDGKRAGLIPLGWFEQWADTTFATDPEGARRSPSVLRAPNGVVADLRENWAAGRAGYDPARITAPTLIAVAEWDRDTPPERAYALFPLLTAAASKRMVVLGEGTHSIMLERNRGALFGAVQVFLEEPTPA